MVFAWTTPGFAGLDIAQVKFKVKHDWDPRQLPRVVHHEYRIPRPRTLCELFFVLVSLVWLLLTGTLSNGVHVGRLVDIINASCQVGFVVAAITTAIEILRELRLMHSRRRAAYAVDSTV